MVEIGPLNLFELWPFAVKVIAMLLVAVILLFCAFWFSDDRE